MVNKIVIFRNYEIKMLKRKISRNATFEPSPMTERLQVSLYVFLIIDAPS